MAEQQFTTEELATEEWRDVVGYEGFYRVSSLGRILSLKDQFKRLRERLIKPGPNPNGRLMFTICKNGHRRPMQVHTLVALAFLGPRPTGYEINHKSGDHQDNRLRNLEYCTKKENAEHARKHRLFAYGDRNALRRHPELVMRGERNGNAVLTAEQVRVVKSKVEWKFGDARRLARQLGVTEQAVWRIRHGISWRHI